MASRNEAVSSARSSTLYSSMILLVLLVQCQRAQGTMCGSNTCETYQYCASGDVCTGCTQVPSSKNINMITIMGVITCVAHYALVPTATAMCTSGTTWSLSQDPCVATCSQRTQPANTMDSYGGVSLGTRYSRLTVTCSTGYALAASSMSGGTTTYQWHTSTTVPYTCSNPTTGFNVLPTCQTCTIPSGQNIMAINAGAVTCNMNYKLTVSPADATATCDRTAGSTVGDWTVPVGIKCTATCSQRTQPANTMDGYGGVSLGTRYSQLSVTCSTGYALATTSSGTTTWHTSTTVMYTCGNPTTGFNVPLTCQTCTIPSGQNIMAINASSRLVTCDTNYKIMPAGTTATCNRRAGSTVGNWTVPAGATCKACSGMVAGGTVGADGAVTCNHGLYRKVAPGYLTCDVNAVWQNHATCEACMGSISDGSVGTNGTVTCNAGHYHVPSGTPTCPADGTWQNLGTCRELPTVINEKSGTMQLFPALTNCTGDSCSFNVTARVESDMMVRFTFTTATAMSNWIGMGISEDRYMPKSDILMVQLPASGMPTASDRWASGHTLPTVDSTQHIYNVTTSAMNGTTTVTFTRPCNTTDMMMQDIALDSDNVYLLFANGPISDPPAVPTTHGMARWLSTKAVTFNCSVAPPVPPTTSATAKSATAATMTMLAALAGAMLATVLARA